MHSKTKISVFSAIHPAAIAAVASLICITAGADPSSQFPNSDSERTLYIAVPGLRYDIPTSYETIGMRQARYAAEVPRHRGKLANPAMGDTWYGIATALDSMADRGDPAFILAPDYVVAQIRSRPLGDSAVQVYRMRVQACENSIDAVEAKSVQFSGDTQAELRNAVNNLEERKAQLERSLSAAEKAAPNMPEGLRSELAADYGRYYEAAARVERLATS